MGGLDDLIPDDVASSSSSRSGSTSSDDDEDKVVIGGGRNKKTFTEERWQEVREVIVREFEHTPNEVLNNLSPQKRFEVVHEAALISAGEKKLNESEYLTDIKCDLCDSDCSTGYVPIEGKKFCPQHSVARVASELGKEIKER